MSGESEAAIKYRLLGMYGTAGAVDGFVAALASNLQTLDRTFVNLMVNDGWQGEAANAFLTLRTLWFQHAETLGDHLDVLADALRSAADGMGEAEAIVAARRNRG